MNHRARKRFGQNFLHDQHVINRIVSVINPRPGEALVEIGPGQGAITLPLLKTVGELDVIELDRDLIQPLAQRCEGVGELRIHNADALRFPFHSLAYDAPIRIVGNLPYNISTPLLFHLLADTRYIVDMHFMLQKEVVDRLAAQPGSRDYGRLSVITQYHCRVSKLFSIGPGAFRPAPKVDSALILLAPHTSPPVEITDPAGFEKLLRQAFAQRRKTLRNNLRGMLDESAIRAAGIDPATRAEMLSLEQFATLAGQLESRL